MQPHEIIEYVILSASAEHRTNWRSLLKKYGQPHQVRAKVLSIAIISIMLDDEHAMELFKVTKSMVSTYRNYYLKKYKIRQHWIHRELFERITNNTELYINYK